jgi:serine/threonine-protein kinase RsbW
MNSKGADLRRLFGADMAKATGHMTDPQAEARASVSLVVPCKPEYVVLCRLVAGALGAREALDEELIADLKVVVTEACNCFLAEPGGCTSPESAHDTADGPEAAEGFPVLRLDFHPTPEAWEITVSNPDGRRRILPASVCDPMSEGGLGLTIIRALVDSVEQMDSDAEGSALHLTKRLSPESAVAD